MGKIFSKFRNPYLSTNDHHTEPSTDMSQNQNHKTRAPSKDPGALKLKELSNYSSFKNVLNISPAKSSICVFGVDDFSLLAFDFSKNQKLKSWKGHEKDITKVLYCHKIDKYISGSRDKSIKLWSINSDQYELNLQAHELVVTSISCDPENRLVISGSRDNNLKLWDIKSARVIKSAHVSRNLVTDTCWSNDGKLLIQTSEDKETRIWDPYNLEIVHSFPKKQYIQSSCHISNDNTMAVTTSNGFQGNGCEITIWDLRMRKMLKELTGHEQTVTCAKIISMDKFIISCSNDSTVKLWDLKELRLKDSIHLSNGLTSVCELPQAGQIMVSSLENGLFTVSITDI